MQVAADTHGAWTVQQLPAKKNSVPGACLLDDRQNWPYKPCCLIALVLRASSTIVEVFAGSRRSFGTWLKLQTAGDSAWLQFVSVLDSVLAPFPQLIFMRSPDFHRLASGCLIFGLAAILGGCGGGVDDPFDRTHVTGSVSIDGQPLKYGAIYFKGEQARDATEVAQALLDIRDGKFAATRAYKPGIGKNSVTVTAYEGDPPPPVPVDDVEGNAPPEPKIVGYWQTEVQIADDAPLSFEIKKSDLQKSPPN